MPCLHRVSASLCQVSPPSHLMGPETKTAKGHCIWVSPGLSRECDWEVDVYTVCQQQQHYQVNSPSLTFQNFAEPATPCLALTPSDQLLMQPGMTWYRCLKDYFYDCKANTPTNGQGTTPCYQLTRQDGRSCLWPTWPPDPSCPPCRYRPLSNWESRLMQSNAANDCLFLEKLSSRHSCPIAASTQPGRGPI